MLKLRGFSEDFETSIENKKFSYTNENDFKSALKKIAEDYFNITYKELINTYKFKIFSIGYSFDKSKDPVGFNFLKEANLSDYGTFLVFNNESFDNLVKDMLEIEDKSENKEYLQKTKENNFFSYIELET